MRMLTACAGAVLLALATTGCAKARAETVADGPPLVVPAPPPREVVAVAVLEAPPPEPITQLQVPTAPPPTPPAPQPQARPPARRPSESDTRPADTAARPGRDVPALPTPAEIAEERAIRTLLQRASRDLGRVSYRTLGAEGRSQFDQSRRFAAQAEAAIKSRNLPFAQTLAEKAATLASGLVGR